jgi:hypothetical protein
MQEPRLLEFVSSRFAPRRRIHRLLLCALIAMVALAGSQAAPGTVAVDASLVGYFGERHAWRLRVDGEGNATLSIDTLPKPTERRFVVPERELAALRTAVERERFFQLADEYGQRVPDGSTTKLAVRIGEREKTVTLRYLMNWVGSDPARLQEPARALRVFQVIRRWFDDADAVDLREEDARVIEAANASQGAEVTR